MNTEITVEAGGSGSAVSPCVYNPIGGDESSQDDESTLKCGAEWSGTDSAHSSTSELSSSSEDHHVVHKIAEDFQWIPRETPTDAAKSYLKPPKITPKPPKPRVIKNKDLIAEPSRANVSNDRRTMTVPAKREETSNSYQEGSVVKRRPNNHLANMVALQPQEIDYTEPTQSDAHYDSQNTSYQNVVTALPPAFDKTGSLDRRRKSSNRSSRDQKCRSSILSHCPSPRFRSPSRYAQQDCYNTNLHKHYDSNSSLYLCPCFEYSKTSEEQLVARHERHDPQRYGSSGMLDRSRHCLAGSQHDVSHCCSCHAPPPPTNSCCHCINTRWRNYKGNVNEVEERIRRLEADKEQLQLQVSVLTEQVEAQQEKMADQEKLLEERKRQLVEAEDLLQREMLCRSSLETQKLELLSVMSDLKLQLAALDRDNLELRRRQQQKPPVGPPRMITSTPVGATLPGSPSPSPVSSDSSPRRLANQQCMDDFKDLGPPKTPPASYRRQVDHYASLPRSAGVGLMQEAQVVRKGVAFGKGFSSSYLQYHPKQSPGGDRSYSTPNLAETESVVIVPEEELEEKTTSLSPQPSPLQFGKPKGIKKIFGKMKRSGSGNLEDLTGEGEFRRGGVRATAGPRLGWTNTPQLSHSKTDGQRLPFVEWDSGTICGWLQEMGLEVYAGEAKRWVKSGAQLLAASAHEIDKELGIKNSLHRKKLQLALLSHQANVTAVDPDLKLASQLDTAWVLRWLDDTGLPQHKDAFLAARVDGRVLHRLTMDDLATLHVTSHLHVASLRRGIQVLRWQGFQPDCLQRRSVPGDPTQVVLWTNHRVMEWLRVVDLAEYAPNLRGSGVHGGLIVYEPRFTAELLASLLAIPPGKTLLRRHLNTHFKELLGKDVIQEKREAEATLGYVPLTPTTKLKIVKKSQFTLKRKKSRSELEFGDLVCPLDPSKTGEQSSLGDGMILSPVRKAVAVFPGIESSLPESNV